MVKENEFEQAKIWKKAFGSKNKALFEMPE
jgi:hypothetical protein